MRMSRIRAVVAAGAGALVVATGLAIGAGSAAAAPSYVALGDSYSSGVGTRDYIDDGTNCMRSNHAYPKLEADRLGATLSFQACSGARTGDVLSNQLGTLNSGTSYVTISIGGNDAGFADVITQCAKPWPWTCTTQIANAQNFIRNTLPGLLDNVYNQIRAKAPSARVVVVGYPRLFNGETCNLAARISTQEEAALNTTADILATTISGRASAHGFSFLDPRSAFTGHAICDDTEWLNGLSNPITESYHPNQAGHQGYANLLQSVLSAGVAAPSAA
jgi:lysophospholipase L1-like esterase